MFKIPKRIDDLLPASAMEKVLDALHQPEIASTVRDALSKVGVKDLNPIDKMQSAWQQTRTWIDSLTGDGSNRTGHQPTTLNATGQLFARGVTGIPMASVVAFGYANSAMAFQSEGYASDRALAAGRNCIGCKEVAWICNAFSAIRLLADAAEVTELLIARTDLLRFEQFGDIQQILELTGLKILEIGASNAAAADDWTHAVQGSHQIVVTVSPNSLSQSQASQQRKDAIAAAHSSGAMVLELLIDGVANKQLAELFGYPLVKDQLESGADVVVLPTDFLLAGPSGVVVAGDSNSIEKARSKAKLAGLATTGPNLTASTTALQLESLGDEMQSSAASLLLTAPENLENRAKRLAIQLDGVRDIQHAEAIQREVPIAESPWDNYKITNWAIKLQPTISPEDLLNILSCGTRSKPILACEDGDAVILDLRFIPPNSDHELVEALIEADSDSKSESLESDSTG